MISPCARTTHNFENIEVHAKSEWPTYGGRMVRWGGSNVNHYCPGMLNTCYIFSRYTGSQHSHTITTPSMPIPCARTTHKLASVSAQAKSEIWVANLWKENDQLSCNQGHYRYGLRSVWKRFYNKHIPTQHLPCHHQVLETIMNWPAFQCRPNLSPLLLAEGGEWWVGVKCEARPIILTQAYWRLQVGIETVSQHYRTITTPAISSPCAETTHKLASIS